MREIRRGGRWVRRVWRLFWCYTQTHFINQKTFCVRGFYNSFISWIWSSGDDWRFSAHGWIASRMKRETGALIEDEDDDERAALHLRQNMNFSPVTPSCRRGSWRFDRWWIRDRWLGYRWFCWDRMVLKRAERQFVVNMIPFLMMSFFSFYSFMCVSFSSAEVNTEVNSEVNGGLWWIGSHVDGSARAVSLMSPDWCVCGGALMSVIGGCKTHTHTLTHTHTHTHTLSLYLSNVSLSLSLSLSLRR